MFADDLRLKGALAVAGNLQRQCAEIAFECLGAVAVADVGGVVNDTAALAVSQVVRHFDLQRTFDQHLGQLLEQAVLAYQVFGFGVIAKQVAGQLTSPGSSLARLMRFVVVIGSPVQAVLCQMTVHTKFLHPLQSGNSN